MTAIDDLMLAFRDLSTSNAEIVAFMIRTESLLPLIYEQGNPPIITKNSEGFQFLGYPIKQDGRHRGIIIRVLGFDWWVSWTKEYFSCVMPETLDHMIIRRDNVIFSVKDIQQAKIKFVG